MNRHPLLLFTLVIGLIALLGVTIIETPVAAQASGETISAQLDLTTPGGHPLSGSLVVRRTLDATGSSTWSFNGMYDGLPAYAEGTAVERWLGEGRLEITVASVNQATVNGQPFARRDALLQTVVVEQSGPGIVTITGIPLAISGPLMPLGSGDLSYILTNAGQGGQRVVTLPNTASQSITQSIPAESSLSLLFVVVALAANGAIAAAALLWRRANAL